MAAKQCISQYNNLLMGEDKMKVYAVERNPNLDGSSVWSVQSLHTTREGAERAMLLERLTPITLDEFIEERKRPHKFDVLAFLRDMRKSRKEGAWEYDFSWYNHWEHYTMMPYEERRRGFPASLYRTILRKLVERRSRKFYEKCMRPIPYNRFIRSPEDGKLHMINHLISGKDLRVMEREVED